MANEVIEIRQEKPVDLAVNLTDRAVQAMAEQRTKLKQFVQSQLKEGLSGDYAKIPGTPKKTLLKPGAEKLANIFQLGSRIVNVEREVDAKNEFAMFTYTVEVFHIPTGKAIAQCQGSANTLEKQQKNKDFGFLVNSLGKIAQKRAFVGAVISATGASDFFTQDMEDSGPRVAPEQPGENDGRSEPVGYRIGFGQWKGRSIEEVYREFGRDRIASYIEYIEGDAKKKGVEISPSGREFITHAEAYLGAMENRSHGEGDPSL